MAMELSIVGGTSNVKAETTPAGQLKIITETDVSNFPRARRWNGLVYRE